MSQIQKMEEFMRREGMEIKRRRMQCKHEYFVHSLVDFVVVASRDTDLTAYEKQIAWNAFVAGYRSQA